MNFPWLRLLLLALLAGPFLAEPVRAGALGESDVGPTPLEGRGLPFGYRDRPPGSVSVAAGVPLTSYEDTTGGFGDVLSNVHMAKAFKRTHPEMRVQLVVWLKDEDRSEVASVADIVKKTLPSVALNRFYEPQFVDGIEVRVVPHDGPKRLAQAVSEGRPLVPRCDFAVQYSANNSPSSEILKATGETWFSFFEPRKQGALVVGNRSFANGLLTTGLYNVDPDGDVFAAKWRLARWTRETTGLKVVADRTVYGYAYTKEAGAARDYQTAVMRLAEKNPDKTYVVFVKKSVALGGKISPNVRIIPLEGFPMEIGNDLIGASDLPPLVTGDSSFATAVLGSRKERAFLYESLAWKNGYVADLKEALAKQAPDVDPKKIFLEDAGRVEAILDAFEDRDLGRKLGPVVEKIRRRSNLVENTLKLHALVARYGDAVFDLRNERLTNFSNALLSDWFATKSGHEFLRRVAARMRSAKNAEEFLLAAAEKIFVGKTLEKADEVAFFRALRAIMREKGRGNLADVATAYSFALSKNPIFQSFIARSGKRNAYAHRYRNLLKDFWLKVGREVYGTPPLATVYREGCVWYLKRPSFEN